MEAEIEDRRIICCGADFDVNGYFWIGVANHVLVFHLGLNRALWWNFKEVVKI